MKQIFRIFRIVLLLFVAVGIVCFIIEDDAWFKKRIELEVVHYVKKAYDCEFSAKIARIRLVTGLVELTDVCISSKDSPAWSCKSSCILIKVSWWKLLLQKMLSIKIHVLTVDVESSMQPHNIALLEHIRKVFSQPGLPLAIELKQFEITKASFLIYSDEETYVTLQMMVDATTLWKKKKRFFVTHIGITNAAFYRNNKLLLHDLESKIIHELDCGSNESTLASLNLKALLEAFGGAKTLIMDGNWKENSAHITLSSPDKSIEGVICYEHEKNTLTTNAHAPLALLMQYVAPVCGSIVKGDAFFEGTCRPRALTDSLLGSLIIKDMAVVVSDKIIFNNAECRATITSDQGVTSVQAAVHHDGKEKAQSTIAVNRDGVMTSDSVITDSYFLPQGWLLPAESLHIKSAASSSSPLQVTYTGTLSHPQSRREQEIKGSLVSGEHSTLLVTGSSPLFSYSVEIDREPVFSIRTAQISNKQPTGADKTVFYYKDLATGGKLMCSYDVLAFVENYLPWTVRGDGDIVFEFQQDQQNNDVMLLSLAMQDGSIRIPLTYNLLQSITGTIRYHKKERRFEIDQLVFALYKGELSTKHAVVTLDDNYRISFACVPLMLKNCFVTLQKDIFALFSGAMIAQYKSDGASLLQGTLVIDRSHIQSNILSQEFKDKLFMSSSAAVGSFWQDVAYDINIMTRALLQVKSPFLEAAARLAVQVKGNLKNPLVSGSIDIIQGSFLFPYKPLFIKQGTITLVPQQLDDPTISLMAENTIRRYTVRMMIDGTLNNPAINFDANPSLEKEQIIGLLLGGSEDGSLYLALPASVSDSLNNLIFGSATSTSQVHSTLNNLLSPLKNIRLVPSFSDQTGRGGLRGALSIEVNDRLRGLIERNFSLTEDMVLAVDYAVSDDVNLRALRDERGDLGGELEARWKF